MQIDLIRPKVASGPLGALPRISNPSAMGMLDTQKEW